MIEDDELREIYRSSSLEGIQQMETGLLTLEGNPDDTETLQEVFRIAHTIKGSSSLLGLDGIGRIMHRFEDVLGEARVGNLAITSTIVDTLYGQIDAIRLLVEEATGGDPSGVDVDEVVGMLSDERLAGTATATKEGSGLNADAPTSAEESEDPALDTQADASPDSEEHAPLTSQSRIESIRVDTRRLDDLIRHVGELIVSTIRLERRIEDIDQLVMTWGNLNQLASIRHTVSATDREGLERIEDAVTMLSTLRNKMGDDSLRLNQLVSKFDEGIREIRTLPFSTVFGLFPRLVRDVARELGKEVDLEISGETIHADKLILEDIRDPLMHTIRNAIDHGIEAPDVREAEGKPRSGTVKLSAYPDGAYVTIEVTDDGRGLDREAILRKATDQGLVDPADAADMEPDSVWRLIFAPSFSTKEIITDVSGRGVGLDVVNSNVERLKGRIELKSAEGEGTCIRIRIPTSVATTRLLLVRVGKELFGLPSEHVQFTLPIAGSELVTLEGRQMIRVAEGPPIAISDLAACLGMPPAERGDGNYPCVVIEHAGDRMGMIVDELVTEQEAIVKPSGRILEHATFVAGSTIIETGDVCVVLRTSALIQAGRSGSVSALRKETPTESPKSVLIVEDSITTRTQVKRILESEGYKVETTVDGLDGFNALTAGSFDAVVSDVEMPNMTGLELVERIRSEEQYRDLPVILVTSLATPEDRQRGADAGANAYITKGGFDQQQLLDALERLV
jgi:two-component system, chemotaxis family, sensor kinase CheA